MAKSQMALVMDPLALQKERMTGLARQRTSTNTKNLSYLKSKTGTVKMQVRMNDSDKK